MKLDVSLFRQDSSFYTNDVGWEVAWQDADNPRFFVVRNGEMRIHAKKNADDEHTEVIRYTDQLESFGIKDDLELALWTNKGEEVFTWVNNSWFEVLDTNEPDYYSEPYHSLDDAIGQAQVLQKEYGNDKVVE